MKTEIVKNHRPPAKEKHNEKMTKHAGGRPSSYQEKFADKAYKLALLGATEPRIAEILEVCQDTVSQWKLDHPKFSEALKKGKADADAQVAKSLYHRALGYDHPAVKIFCSKDGEVTQVPYTEHYPPDTAACIFWLKNRQKETWRDWTRHELSGPNGKPIEIRQPVDLRAVDGDELRDIVEEAKRHLAEAAANAGEKPNA